ncbi:MAG: Adaptive-response sensory-kinase SasA [Verrucomicrobiae bacterium]|nr:Adaptive-response sensory-kinase SasA [Verrucomicrobiae bacterium]
MNHAFDISLLEFPPEWVKAALVLALISVWVVIGLFTYLNRYTKKRYFSLWTVAWMFYSVYLAASIGLEETPDTPFLMLARRACIGISALFMFWGTLDMTGRKRDLRELGLAVLMILAWSYVAAYHVRREYWITLPVFILLASAGVQAGLMCLRQRRSVTDTRILGVGFGLWGLHLLAFPFLNLSPALMAGAYLTSAILASVITVGMVVEQQVALSEQNYRTLFDSASDAMFLVEHDTWRILDANPAAQRISQNCGAHSLAEVFPELSSSAGIAAQTPALRRELRRARVDGQFQIYEASANLMLLPRGPVLLLVARDITERAQAEESLRRSKQQLENALHELRQTQSQVVQQERLRALGQMASGVAHDFNNALAKILGFNDLLLHTPEHLRDPEKIKKYLHMVSTSAQDAVQIVNRLREFYRSRKDTDPYEPVRLDQIVEQAIILTQPRWKDQMLARGVSIEIGLDLEETPFVRGNAAELREVVISLTFNAVDALPGGGRIHYRTRRENGQVLLTVTDTGVGMSEEVRRRCFEPFFSTKGEGGTGLGLAIVYGIVQRHGGRLDVDSTPGQGATFAVRLPVAAVELPVPVVDTPVPPLRILLMEDEPLILEIEKEYLLEDGHTVETALNGRLGLEKFRGGRYDIVMVDRAMPVLNGEQVAVLIKQSMPNTPVILVTGFTELLTPGGATATAVDLVVTKPFTATALRQAIATVMTRRLNHNN